MKDQAPVLLAVVVPSALEPPSETVTVAPATAVPVRVTEPLAFAAPVLMTGAAGATGAAPPTVRSNTLDGALVANAVVSVAVNA